MDRDGDRGEPGGVRADVDRGEGDLDEAADAKDSDEGEDSGEDEDEVSDEGGLGV